MLTALIFALPAPQSAPLEVMATGATPVIGGYRPQRLELTSGKPGGLTSAPTMSNPMYGVLSFGAAGATKTFIVAVDGDKFYVDANGNGNLNDDPATEWSSRNYKGSDQKDYVQRTGGFNLVHPQLNKSLHFGAYLFDPNETARAALKNVLLYYCDYALTANMMFGDKKHKVMMVDWNATGDFGGTDAQFMVDRDDDGKFDGRYEYYSPTKPFNISGTTYELDTKNIANNQIALKVSSTTVPEIVAPPNLSVGKKVLPFEADATDGTKIKFPSTYKGKLVMLDFWATWCGPCIAELPNVTKAYDMYHDRGFEILSISLDQENALEKLTSFTKEHNMPWRQVYDGKYWQARIAVMYGINSIPRVLLVDGDTGEIIADNATLRGETIFKTLDNALTKKFGK